MIERTYLLYFKRCRGREKLPIRWGCTLVEKKYPVVDILDNIHTVNENRIEYIQDGVKISEKSIKQFKLMEMGETAENALRLTNCKNEVSKGAIYNLEQRYKKWSLQRPEVVELAGKQFNRILKGGKRTIKKQKVTNTGQVIDYTEQIAPSDTTILAAVSMVYDRYEPVVNKNVNINVNLAPIDLSEFRNV